MAFVCELQTLHGRLCSSVLHLDLEYENHRGDETHRRRGSGGGGHQNTVSLWYNTDCVTDESVSKQTGTRPPPALLVCQCVLGGRDTSSQLPAVIFNQQWLNGEASLSSFVSL